ASKVHRQGEPVHSDRRRRGPRADGTSPKDLSRPRLGFSTYHEIVRGKSGPAARTRPGPWHQEGCSRCTKTLSPRDAFVSSAASIEIRLRAGTRSSTRTVTAACVGVASTAAYAMHVWSGRRYRPGSVAETRWRVRGER